MTFGPRAPRGLSMRMVCTAIAMACLLPTSGQAQQPAQPSGTERRGLLDFLRVNENNKGAPIQEVPAVPTDNYRRAVRDLNIQTEGNKDAQTAQGQTVPSAVLRQAPKPTATSAAQDIAPSAPAPSIDPLPSQPVGSPYLLKKVDLTQDSDDLWSHIRKGYAIPNLDTPLVAERTLYFANKPNVLQVMFERAGAYLYHIVSECERRGMPTELALLPFVESAFNPFAMSPARASGLWQFIPSTGRNYKLKQDGWRDERRDVIASTNAALDYLSLLYDMYGDWHLALAAYNWGEGNLKKAIEKNKARDLPTDYLSLSLPDETRNYVPRLQAFKNLIADPGLYGITLPYLQNQPYFTTVTTAKNLDMRKAAALAGMRLEEFRALNPSHNRSVVKGSDGLQLVVPMDKVNQFMENLDKSESMKVSEPVEGGGLKGGRKEHAVGEAFGVGSRGHTRAHAHGSGLRSSEPKRTRTASASAKRAGKDSESRASKKASSGNGKPTGSKKKR